MATLTVLEGTQAGREYEILDVNILGRGTQCDVKLGDLTVSRRHCQILRQGNRFFIEDLASGNGTYVNRQPVVKEELRHNDEVRIGYSRFRFANRHQGLLAIGPGVPQTGPVLLDSPVASRTSIDREIDPSNDLLLNPVELFNHRPDLEPVLRQLQTVYTVSQVVSSILSIDELLDEILDQIMRVFPQAERGAVLVRDESSDKLLPHWVRFRSEGSRGGVSVSPQREPGWGQLVPPVFEAVVNKRKAVLVSEQLPEAQSQSTMAAAVGQGATVVPQGSMMCAPLVAGGEVLGILQLFAGPQQVFHRDDLDLHAGIAAQAGLAMANARLHERLLQQSSMNADMQVAEQIQRSFLPRVLPTVPGYSFHAHYDPAYEVGGDFYDFVELPDGRWAILIGDVSGKGLAAALLMARVTSELRVYALSEREPSRVLDKVNRAIVDMGQDDKFVTAIYAVLDPLRRRLVWSSAGHLPLYLRRKADGGSIEPLEEVGSAPLGYDPETRYEEDSLEMKPDDAVVLYTDGVVESKDKTGAEFGFKRLAQAIGAGQSAGDILGLVVDQVSHHAGGEKQYDDVTLVTIGCTDSPETWQRDLIRRMSP